jgi:hypothetical protein
MTESMPEPSATPRPRPKRLWLVVAVAVVAVLAAGFVIYRLTASERFDSPRALAGRLAELGAPCRDFEADAKWPNRAQCQSGKDEVTIEISSGSQWPVLQTMVEASTDTMKFSAAYDDGWALYGYDRDYIEKAADLLGGEFRTR